MAEALDQERPEAEGGHVEVHVEVLEGDLVVVLVDAVDLEAEKDLFLTVQELLSKKNGMGTSN